jgi:hypothetical protein
MKSYREFKDNILEGKLTVNKIMDGHIYEWMKGEFRRRF